MDNEKNPTHADIYRGLGVLEGKLDSLALMQSRHMEASAEMTKQAFESIGKLRGRIDRLEAAKAWYAGGLAAIVAIGGAALAWLSKS